jgi:hypothetical protein
MGVFFVNFTLQAGEVEYLITDNLAIGIKDGYITNFIAVNEGKDYLPEGVPAPILQIRLTKDGGAVKEYPPSSMTWTDPGKELLLDFGTTGVTVKIKVVTKNSYVTFEVIDVQPFSDVELVLWGPYPTTINKRIGESIGVAQGETFAIGIQGLNVKTLGGYPQAASSCDYTMIRSINDKNEYENIFEKVKENHRMWGDTAWRTSFGSVLQAFTRDRSNPGQFTLMNFQEVEREPINDGGIINSKIALFGSPIEDALHTIGIIEEGEGLPHPVLDNGEWVKESNDTISTYIANTYNANPGLGDYVDNIIDWAKGSHIKTFYFSTPGPFHGVGHYEYFNTGWFPEVAGDHGVGSYTTTNNKVENNNYWVGTHTMSAMISMNDRYVTELDPRLKSYGSCELVSNVSASDTSFV